MRSHSKALFAVAALLAFLTLASTASAEVIRPFTSQITEADGESLIHPWGLAVGASDDLWASDVQALNSTETESHGRVLKFGANGAFLAENTSDFSGTSAGYFIKSLAFDDSLGDLYIGDNFATRGLWVLNPDASLHSHIAATWGTSAFATLSVAIDNSGTASDGTVFVTAAPGLLATRVLRLEGTGAPSNFSGSAPYISGNELTGTPGHEFGKELTPEEEGSGEAIENAHKSIEGIAVDQANGDIYVLDGGNKEVDRFNAEGTFVSALDLAAFGTSSALAVDPNTHDVLVADIGQDEVREFDASGALVREIDGSTTPVGSFEDPQGVTVDSQGKLYVADTGHHVIDVFGPAVDLPVVTTGAATDTTPTSATLHGTVDPDGLAITDCKFEYGTTTAFEESVPCDVDPGSGSSPVAVSADVSGLTPEVAYHVRLSAANANGRNFGKDQPISTGPKVETLPAQAVSAATATLGGKVNPNGEPTTFYMEYSKNASFVAPSFIPAEKDAAAGSGEESLIVSQRAMGLAPNTEYHFRIVASNSGGTAIGAARTFTTLSSPSAALPDGRVYEKASPADKHGTSIGVGSSGGYFSRASVSGDAVAYSSVNISFGGEGAPLGAVYVSNRHPSGWFTKGISAPIEPHPAGNPFNGTQWLSPDLSKSVQFTAAAINSGDPPGLPNLYLRDSFTDTYRLLSNPDPAVPIPPIGYGGIDDAPLIVYANSEADHIVFQSFYRLTSDGGPLDEEPGGPQGLYEWANGEVSPVGVLPDGTSAPGAVPAFDSPLGLNPAKRQPPEGHMVSEDGSHVYFVNASADSQQIRLGLYVRVSGATTEHVSLSEASGPNPDEENVRFQFAKASDGSVAFFTDDKKRTEDSVPGVNLYRWDGSQPAGSRLTDITTGDPKGAGVVEVMGGNDDATRVYFRATGVLAPGGIAGHRNIYLWQQGTGVRYVAEGSGVDDARFFATIPMPGESRISPLGDKLLFESQDRLTAYDNAGYTQLYLYDADAAEIQCISCNPRASQSVGDSSLGQESVRFSIRNMSGEANRIFFQSPDPLVSQDTNGKLDVYEWENGELHLLSSGSSKSDSQFLDASSDGNDAFFVTSEPLVRSDTDSLIDAYDARVGGVPEPAPVPGCLGDECQGTPKAPPVFSPPSSSTYSGPGNETAKKQKKKRKAKRHAKKTRHGKQHRGRKHG